MKVRVTVLVENTVRQRGLLAEHGLAYWIELGDRCILFDTGQGMAIEHNASELAIDLSCVDDLVLSHGHYDHVGGVESVLRDEPAVRVFAHPSCTEPKFRRTAEGQVLDVGMSSKIKRVLEEAEQREAWIKTEACTQICPGLFVTGPIPRANDLEDTGGQFYLDDSCTRKDVIVDDHALFFDSNEGVVVMLGCAHAGVINTLDFIAEQLPDRPVHAILGGMHLLNASAERLQRTVDRLEQLGVSRLAAGHCTGDRAITKLRKAFPERVSDFRVGSVFSFQIRRNG